MARDKVAEPVRPSTMKELKDTLWKAADKLRGSMEASQYKDVVLGLIFLKYVSDAFDERQREIRAELEAAGWDAQAINDTLTDKDEYTGSRVFWVPAEARWRYLAERAKVADGTTIGQRLDTAMDGLVAHNPQLTGALSRMYNRDFVDQRRLAELIDLLNTVQFAGQGAAGARDLLGEVYEYFVARFALAEGRRGGEFYTPASVVRVLVEMLQPWGGRVYDPCCGSGGMFVQAERFLAAHHREGNEIAVYGQEAIERTWRLAKMNLAIHAIQGNLGSRWGDTFGIDYHAGIQMDYVLANPPFNVKDWNRREDDARWRYGVPPARNANYGWLQHIISKLSPSGTAGVVLANGSMTSNSGGEGQIRAQLVENDLVTCMIALPDKLFRSTGIPVCLWFFDRNKNARPGYQTDRRGQVLFIDARELGHMVTRAERAFSTADIRRIADTYHAWRGMPIEQVATADITLDESLDEQPPEEPLAYEDVPGFCRSVTLAEIKDAGYALTPGRYVGMAEPDEDDEPLDEKIARLTVELEEQFAESDRLQRVVQEQLRRVL